MKKIFLNRYATGLFIAFFSAPALAAYASPLSGISGGWIAGGLVAIIGVVGVIAVSAHEDSNSSSVAS